MKKFLLSMVMVLGMAVFMELPAMACTSYYVGSELTKDGSTMFGRTEDIGSAYDKVFQVIQPKEIKDGDKWVDESGVTEFTHAYKDGLKKTYRYTACRDNKEEGAGLFGEVGVNEKGVSMSATTTASCTDEAEQADPFVDGGISEENYVDYVLCQADSARDGVEILAKAIDDCGVWYTADGIFIADKNEVWFFEVLAGHQYCAIKMPKDKAALIPNCLVIGDVDLDSPDVIHSEGVVTVAQAKGIYHEATTNPETNDINLKLTYGGNGYRMYDADRIRTGQYILAGIDNIDIYTDNYQNIFFDAPKKSVTVEKLYQLAGSQNEEFEDFNEKRPTRVEMGDNYWAVRCIGVSDSAECHIIQLRSDMPTELATIQWMSLSSAAYTTFVPFYGAAITDVPAAYKEEANKYSETSAYWICQSLGEYARKNADTVGVSVKNIFKNYMAKLVADQKTVDEQMMELYKTNPSAIEKKATELGISIGTQTLEKIKELKKEVMYRIPTTNFDEIQYTLEPKQEEIVNTQTPVNNISAPAKVSIKKLKNISKKKLQIKLTKIQGAVGYEVAYSTSVNFAKSKTKYKTISAKTSSGLIKKLKKGKKNYIKARAYTLDGTKKIYGDWSKIKIIKVKK